MRRACGSDETLLSHVLLALGEDVSQSGFWDEVAAGESGSHDPAASLEGQRLGPYRIVRKLGSGGMGDVYLAERADEEYQQQVAIKLVRSGVFSRQVQSRLRMERQILATLQHPNIARLLDGGRAPDGTPYLVMEYIDGEPIDAYCDRRRLSLEERLALVRTVCAAVHYAHQNLIVHRDLKPNNILITPQGVPKLLDFGIAKLLDTRQSAQTLAVTHVEYRVMTPAHASPEQVRGDVITTASDIYVLGVLLYELLCGRRPFQLVGASLLEMERIICEQEALTPSAMVARTARESPELLADIVACRSTTPARLQKQLRGDLDNIVGMAMRKDAERRYSSAEQLAADLERHLDGQAGARYAATPGCIARASSSAGTRSRSPRRLLAVVTLAAFATITFVQAQRIAYERDVATAERTRAEQVSSFLVELFELSDPSRSRGNQVTARELLDIGARRVSLGLADQPETRATLLGTIGTRVPAASACTRTRSRCWKKALKSQHRAFTVRVIRRSRLRMRALGDALCDRGDLAQCEAAPDCGARHAARAARSDCARNRADADGAGAARAAARRLRRRGAPVRRRACRSIARTARSARPAPTSVMNELASLYSYRGRQDRAATLYRAALDIDRQALGNDHPQVGMHLHNLAVTLQAQGKLEEAAPLYEESMQILQRGARRDAIRRRSTRPRTTAASCIGAASWRAPRRCSSEVVELDRQARGPRHAFVGHDLVNLGMVRLDMQQHAQAEQDFRAALDIYAEALPADHPYVVSALSGLGRSHARAESPRRSRADAAASEADRGEVPRRRQSAAGRSEQLARASADGAAAPGGSRAAAARELPDPGAGAGRERSDHAANARRARAVGATRQR